MLKQRVAEYMEHAPDILNCLSSLSSDEVFTPPKLADAMLAMLPQNLFWNPNARFIDPACKSGVFLRQIAKRLIMGLEDDFPDLRKRLNHIFSEQLFGIATTKLAALISRRTLYCSRTADSEYSIAQDAFKGNPNGNIWWDPECARHEWNSDGRCAVCGAPKSVYGGGGEGGSHAYEFIHSNGADRLRDMKVDVVITNPPYQMADGGAQASARPVYHLFIEQAKELHPQHIVMIFPARWYTGGKGLDDFRKEMLSDVHVRELHDYPCASDCFPGVEIKGGVCIVHWDSSYNNMRNLVKVVTHPGNGKEPISRVRSLKYKDNIFIRHEQALHVLEKTAALAEEPVSVHVSSMKPFGLRTFFADSDRFKASPKGMKNPVPCWGKGMQLGFVEEEDVPFHREWIGRWKVFVPRANNISTEAHDDNLNSFCGRDEICTESYIVVGAELGLTEETAKNFAAYLRTKFARFCHSLAKVSQDATAKTYRFVPMQDFSRPWTDKELYAKYGLSKEETSFIESMIRPMA